MQHNAAFTRDDVVTAALEIGVDRFTMGKVARRLGVSTADLGRTVSSRDDLLVACLERVSADVTLPSAGLRWPDYLRQLSDSLWDVLDANPGLDHTLIDLAWAYVPFMSVAKRAHSALVSGGLRSEDAYLALSCTLSTVLTSHRQAAAMAETIESEHQPGRRERGIDIATRMWDERFGGSGSGLGRRRSHALPGRDDTGRVPFRPEQSWLNRGAMRPRLEVLIGGFSGLSDVLSTSGAGGDGAARGASPALQSNDTRELSVNTLVLVFHPNISESRVNKALGAAAESLGGGITVRYMYDLYPDFNIDVATEQAALLSADRIVLQYPLYWLSCPPLLKKWLDDVLTFGWAYGSTGTALHGKELLLAVSVGGAGSAYGREGAHVYTIHEFLRPMQGTSRVVGTRYAVPFLSVGALEIADEAIARRARDYAAVLQSPELPMLDIFG